MKFYSSKFRNIIVKLICTVIVLEKFSFFIPTMAKEVAEETNYIELHNNGENCFKTQSENEHIEVQAKDLTGIDISVDGNGTVSADYIADTGRLTIYVPSGKTPGNIDDKWKEKIGSGATVAAREIKVVGGVKADSCWRLFSGLSNMTKIDLTGVDTSNATNMRAMFQCHSLNGIL